MNDYCRNQPRKTQCEPTIIEGDDNYTCTPFDVCLPFGRSLHYNGYCLSVAGSPSVADGEYGVIVVKDGCIVDARPSPVLEYTPAPCTPATTPCEDSTPGGDISVQPDSCNLLTQDGAGRLGAFLVAEAGEGVIVRGCGSSRDPLVISIDAQEQDQDKTYMMNSETVIVTGDGSLGNPYTMSLTPVVTPGTYGMFTVDASGRITAVSQSGGSSSIASLVEGPGIKITTASDVATVGLTPSGTQAGTYQLGGYNVGVDVYGRVASVNNSISITAGTIDPYFTAIAVNNLGSITGLGSIVRDAADVGIATQTGGTSVRVVFGTERRGYIYVEVDLCEPADGISAPEGVLSASVTSAFTATVNGGNVTNMLGICTTVDGTLSVTKLFFQSSGAFNPGTITVELTRTGTVTTFSNPARMVAICAQ